MVSLCSEVTALAGRRAFQIHYQHVHQLPSALDFKGNLCACSPLRIVSNHSCILYVNPSTLRMFALLRDKVILIVLVRY